MSSSVEIRFPKLADTLVDGTITRWLKRIGDPITLGEPIVEIETDKVSAAIESPASGFLIEVLAPEGDIVSVGEVIGHVGTELTSLPAQPPQTSNVIGDAATTRASGLSPIRRRIAERMQEARLSIPQGACVWQLDLRNFDRRGLSWTTLFVRALAFATNVSDISIAVETDAGLMVPVARNVRESTTEVLAVMVDDLVRRARDGQLTPVEVAGSLWTVTNVGSLGTLMAFPIVTPGQHGVLAVGAISEARCYTTLVYDRREIDDFAADRLLKRVASAFQTGTGT
jgi:pyruvate/2-oxoglutarate dehydrogenase complex dihydrolipoamide acyltransferase (E2) component